MRAVAVVVLGLLVPAAARAWGYEGHRIVGDLAWHELTPAAKARVRELLPSGRYGTLAEAGIWADREARRDPRWEWLAPYHYVNPGPDAGFADVPRDCACVIGAIERFADELADPERPFQQRVNALRLVAHFVADVHQPLHAGGADGRGGTRTDVRLGGRWHDLHYVWDTALIRRRLGGQDWRVASRELAAATRDAERARWAAERDPRAWASESLALARRHTYATRDGERLPRDYPARMIPIVEQRLRQAGVRLGALLNERLGEP